MSAEIKPIDTFFSKVSELPDWQQDILVRIIRHGKDAVIGLQIGEIVSMVKGVYKIPLPEGVAAPVPVKITRDLLPEDLAASDDITIYKINEIKNVNALAESGIEFTTAAGAGLTIVYGRNGSGKSGFIRILKAISAVRQKESEPVYQNCITGDQTPSSAKIHIGGNEHIWNQGNTGNPSSRKMRIFDSKNADIYVFGESGGKTEIVYSPDCFSLLDDLAAVMTALENQLSADKLALVNPYQIVNQKFQEQGIKGLKITKDTPALTITDWLSWDDTKEAQWKQIKSVIEDKKPLQLQKQLFRTLLGLNQQNFQAIEGFLSLDKIKEFFEKRAEQKGLEEALTKLREITEKDNPLPKVCSGEWENLWRAAVAFIGGTYPADKIGDTCPLCMQPIAGDTKARVEKFHAWVSNDLKKKLDTTKYSLASKETLLSGIGKTLFVPKDLDEALKAYPALHTRVSLFISNAADNLKILQEKLGKDDFQAQDFKEVKICVELFGDGTAEHLGFVGQLDKEIVGLNAADAPEQVSLYEKLKANIICCQLQDQVKGLKSYDTTFDNFGNAIGKCSTRAISLMKTTLNKTFVGDRFNEFVEKEKDFFALPYGITFNISSSAGKSMQALACANASLSPSLFMSEGEAKVAALSCFLAEYKMSGAKIPLVFDDPITSLDHNFQGLVVKRLIELAKETQVVVFTHNLVFSNELCREAEAAGTIPKMTYLKCEKGVSGIEHTGEWEAKKIGAKIQFIRDELAKLDDSAKHEIRGLGGKIRQIWEQSIEDTLFNGTITRFNKEVKTQSLEVVRIDDDIYPMVKVGMTKTSAWADHSQAAAVDSVITKKDVSDALSELETFIDTAKKKRAAKAAAPANKVI